MSWTLQFTTTVRREIGKLDPSVLSQLELDLQVLAANPLGGKLLHGRLKGMRSWRSGDYRIVYGIDAPRYIMVYRVAHRREVYRD